MPKKGLLPFLKYKNNKIEETRIAGEIFWIIYDFIRARLAFSQLPNNHECRSENFQFPGLASEIDQHLMVSAEISIPSPDPVARVDQ